MTQRRAGSLLTKGDLRVLIETMNQDCQMKPDAPQIVRLRNLLGEMEHQVKNSCVLKLGKSHLRYHGVAH